MNKDNKTLIDDVRVISEKMAQLGSEMRSAAMSADERICELQAEVERLREDNQLLRRQNGSLTQQVIDRGQERDQLKAALNEANSKLTDINDTFYGKNMTVAGWHLNGSHEPMDSFFEDNDWEPVEGDVPLAARDAEVIEQVASELAIKARDECSRVEYQSGYLAAVNDAFTAASQLRQQAKGVQS